MEDQREPVPHKHLPKKLSDQVVTIVITGIVTALLTLLLKSGVWEERSARSSADMSAVKARLDEITVNGSPVLRNRMDAVEKRTERMEEKIDDMWRVIVKQEPPPRRAGQ